MGLSVISEAMNPFFSISATVLRVNSSVYSLSSKVKISCLAICLSSYFLIITLPP